MKKVLLLFASLLAAAGAWSQEATPIDGAGTIAVTAHDDYYGDQVLDYQGTLSADVTAEGSTVSITLKNILVYQSYGSISWPYGFGNFTFSNLTLDAEGNIDASAAELTFAEGDAEDVDEWEATSFGDATNVVVSGTLVGDALEATFTFDVDGPYNSYTFEITFGSATSLPDFEYARTTTPEAFGTLVLNFTPETVTGIEALYSIAGKTVDAEGNPTSIVLQAEETIEAGVPYIFVANADEITATAPSTAATASQPKNVDLDWDTFETIYLTNGLFGTFDQLTVDADLYEDIYWDTYIDVDALYVLSNNKVVKAAEGSTVAANRAYILFDAVPLVEEEAATKGIRLYLNNQTTGVKSVATAAENAVIFNLAGQRVSKAQKGINIVGGRKVVK